MNILMLTNTFTPHVGGVARSVASFSDEYRRLGHRVVVVAPQFEGVPEHEEDVVRVPAIQNFNGSDFSVPVPIPGFLNAAVEQLKPDIIHSHHPFLLGDTALRMAAKRNVPVVFTHHTQYDRYTHYVANESPALRRFVSDLVTGYCNLCDAVIAPSESIASLLVTNKVKTRIEVIPTGIDVAQFSDGNGRACRTALGLPLDAFVVGHVGRLAPEKNLEFLTQAVASFLNMHPNSCFLVVGSGPSADYIHQFFTEQGLHERLYHSENLQGAALADAYKAMNVFAFASQTETQGLVLTEAMAAGVPVVAVEASGVREVVRDGKNGRMLAQQDTGQFASALQWIALLPEPSRELLTKAAYNTAQEFAMSRCAPRALALYESLLISERTTKEDAETRWTAALRLIDEEWKIIATKARAAGAALIKTGTPPNNAPPP